MTMPSSAEISRLQDDLQAALLPDTCAILGRTSVSDGQGGATDTWGTVTASVACLIEPYGGRGRNDIGFERMIGGAVNPFSTWVLTLPEGTTLTQAHRVKCGTVEYNVTAVDNGISWPAAVTATLEKV